MASNTKPTPSDKPSPRKPRGAGSAARQGSDGSGQVRWAGRQSLGDRLTKGLGELKETLESGQRVEDRYTMRTVELDLRPEDFDADRIKKLRERLSASQAVFAELLGASIKTVQAWESGQAPAPMARRLLEVIEREPERWIDMLEAGRREA